MLWKWVLLFWITAAWSRAAAQMETQHAFDGSFRLNQRLDLVLHARLRTQPGALGVYQARGGPIVEYEVRNGLKLIVGYYYARQENSQQDFIGGQRWFGGGEAGLWTGRAAKADLRALAERFLPAQGESFGRYRLRLRVSGKQALAPYASVEPLLDARGWRSTRYASGLRIGNGGRVSVDLGYFYEPRRADVGRTRHMVMMGLYWNFGTKRRGDAGL